MKAKAKKYRKIVIMCAILLTCSVLFTLMPHLHRCSEMECSVCDFTKTFREISVILASLLITLFGISLFTSVLLKFDIIAYPRDNTLVGRKVKLSD